MKQPTGSLLFVEDDVIVRDIICSFITARYPSMIVDAAGSADEGLELFEKQRHVIVLTDVNLIDSDGISMARAIREKAPETVIIFVTGSADVEQFVPFEKTGHCHVIIKPVECDALLELLDTFVINGRGEHVNASGSTA